MVHSVPLMVTVNEPGGPVAVPAATHGGELVELSEYMHPEVVAGFASWITVTCLSATVMVVCRDGAPGAWALI
jgi:hypothetical protein